MSKKDLLVWIDLEMTGLDPVVNEIVEFAVVITGPDLALVDPGLSVVCAPSADAEKQMDDFVRKMHTQSGLLAAIETEGVEFSEATTKVLDYIKSFVEKESTAPMCGNTIGMDRRFLTRYAPEIDNYLHYRSIDVSSFKEICRRWYPEVFKKRPGKSEKHRALDDILESIKELAFYREHIFRPT